jgi:hypothetical protein
MATRGIPTRVGQLLLAYGSAPRTKNGELLAFPRAVGAHLRQVLAEAGYVTVAPHLGIFASRDAATEVTVTARPPRATRVH